MALTLDRSPKIDALLRDFFLFRATEKKAKKYKALKQKDIKSVVGSNDKAIYGDGDMSVVISRTRSTRVGYDKSKLEAMAELGLIDPEILKKAEVVTDVERFDVKGKEEAWLD